MNKLPTMNRKFLSSSGGFSLVEMAIVLAIVALLMAGLLPTLSGQIEQGRRTETRKLLDEIQQALVGYAIINGYFPCPTTTADPAHANYGLADASCSSPAAEGYLPWKTLGVAETDAWGVKRSSAGSQWIGYWRYRVEPSFASGVPFTLTTTSNTTLNLQVRDNANIAITNTGSMNTPVAIVYSTGPNLTADGQNSSYEQTTSAIYQSDTPNSTFDDMTIWISRPALFSRMVAAGKLP
ncbi:MAG: prepilin-type N-terminal cleavage/methylation domain-containing protein [Sideroxyarcus sp.]|nr:prepilin-type N-terminal cleavage/methylation domain-containing protein [Sideroxyarcus sp.]